MFANPRCLTYVYVEPWMRDALLSVRVAETDFDSPDEFVSAVLVNNTSVALLNDLRTGAADCRCHDTTLVAEAVPLPGGGVRVPVEVRTTQAVTKMPCCCCGMSLRAEAVVHHSSGLACTRRGSDVQ